jgi:hypothetical protein
MPDALSFEFTAVGAGDYRAVNAILGLDPETGDGAWPAGLITHPGAAADGSFVVRGVGIPGGAIVIDGDAFGPARTGAGIPEPVRSSG